MSTEKKRILIVDDNQAIHEDLKHILGHKVSAAYDEETQALENELFSDKSEDDVQSAVVPAYFIDDAYQGQEAIDMVQKAEKEGTPYSLVFMDVRMPPGMDGIQTIQKIWEKYPHIEMIICTAYSDYSWDKIIQELGLTDHLHFMKKPFDTVAVRQATLSLTKKWDVNRENQKIVDALEFEVEKRTNQLNYIMHHLENLKHRAEQNIITRDTYPAKSMYEIRTPLNGIMGMADLLLDTDLSEEQRDFAENIKSTSDSLLIIINDILDYSKIELGDLELEEVDFSLRNAVDNVTDLISISAHEKELRIATLIQSDVPDILFGDPLRVRQILLNFLTNSVKYTEKGDITISVSHAEAPSHDDKNDKAPVILRFEVSDTGCGIPQDIQLSLLEKPSKDKNSSTKKKNHTGLGLSISKQLVSLMGGTIGVETEEGKGSTVWFTSKFKTGRMISTNPPDSFGSITGMQCLIVGDNPISRKVLSLHINQWGGICSESPSIQNTVEKLQTSLNTKPIDVVILDFKDADAATYIQAALEIRRYKNLDGIQLVCLLSKLRKGDVNSLKENGFKGYLIKPLKQSHLYNCLLMIKWIMGGDVGFKGIDMITSHLADVIASDCYRILVAEDDDINQKIIVSLLNKVKIRCDVAQDGKEAVDAFLRNKYDLIIMDCQMPELDGFKAAQIIRENEKPGEHIPIIALTAAANAQNMKKSLAAGMDDFISKPFKFEDISETLRKHLKTSS